VERLGMHPFMPGRQADEIGIGAAVQHALEHCVAIGLRLLERG
jgi:hypothetical protein